MKYHSFFVIFEKVANLKLSSAANYRWRFKFKMRKKIMKHAQNRMCTSSYVNNHNAKVE